MEMYLLVKCNQKNYIPFLKGIYLFYVLQKKNNIGFIRRIWWKVE